MTDEEGWHCPDCGYVMGESLPETDEPEDLYELYQSESGDHD